MFTKITKFLNVFQAEKTDQQQEAIIELLLIMMYLDDALKMAENNFIQKYAAEMEWNPGTPPDYILNTAYAKVRSVIDNPEKTTHYIEELSARLGNENFRLKAIQACTELAKTDGDLTPKEDAFIKKLQEIFEVK